MTDLICDYELICKWLGYGTVQILDDLLILVIWECAEFECALTAQCGDQNGLIPIFGYPASIKELLFLKFPDSLRLEGFAAHIWKYTSCLGGSSSFQLPNIEDQFMVKRVEAPDEEV